VENYSIKIKGLPDRFESFAQLHIFCTEIKVRVSHALNLLYNSVGNPKKMLKAVEKYWAF